MQGQKKPKQQQGIQGDPWKKHKASAEYLRRGPKNK